jgi:hypothetical protein
MNEVKRAKLQAARTLIMEVLAAEQESLINLPDSIEESEAANDYRENILALESLSMKIVRLCSWKD